jgi:hypothetical protein
MRIYIPTRSRPNFSAMSALPEYLHHDVYLVLRKDEVALYANTVCHKMILPKKVEGLAATRQWILENAEDEFICMMDDDITHFLFKPVLSTFGGLVRATNANIDALFHTMERWLDEGVVCASTADRMALARPAEKYFAQPSRVGQVMFIDRWTAMERGYRFDRVQIYHDQDFALQILRGRDMTRISTKHGHAMRPTYAKGGLQTYRNQNVIDESAQRMLELHPGLITLKWRDRLGYSIPTRIIKWKQAMQEGWKL